MVVKKVGDPGGLLSGLMLQTAMPGNGHECGFGVTVPAMRSSPGIISASKPEETKSFPMLASRSTSGSVKTALVMTRGSPGPLSMTFVSTWCPTILYPNRAASARASWANLAWSTCWTGTPSGTKTARALSHAFSVPAKLSMEYFSFPDGVPVEGRYVSRRWSLTS